MSRPSQPLLFLAAVVGAWTMARIVALAPAWEEEEARAPRLAAGSAWIPGSSNFNAAPLPPDAPFRPGWHPPLRAQTPHPRTNRRPMGDSIDVARAATLPLGAVPAFARSGATSLPSPALPRPLPSAAAPPLGGAPIPSAAPASTIPGRLQGSAWLLVRDDVWNAALAPGGTLGGSQAGLRVIYRLNADPRRPLALSARVNAPLARPAGSEVAVGLDWRPLAGLPLQLLAERREAIGRDGRSDFSLTLYGGVDRPLARGRLHLQAYGQAGVVGTRGRDLFADGAARLTARAGPVHVGGGVWGGAQPGVERLDVGPHTSLRVPVGRAALTIAAE